MKKKTQTKILREFICEQHPYLDVINLFAVFYANNNNGKMNVDQIVI